MSRTITMQFLQSRSGPGRSSFVDHRLAIARSNSSRSFTMNVCPSGPTRTDGVAMSQLKHHGIGPSSATNAPDGPSVQWKNE